MKSLIRAASLDPNWSLGPSMQQFVMVVCLSLSLSVSISVSLLLSLYLSINLSALFSLILFAGHSRSTAPSRWPSRYHMIRVLHLRYPFLAFDLNEHH
jgi:hypothetical protein